MPSMDIIDAEVKEKVNNFFNREYTFKPKNLKNIFPELKSEEDFSLIPLFDRITRMFIVDLKQNPSNYSVSSFSYAGKDGSIPRCHYFENGRIYDLKMGGQKHRGVVSMNMHKTDINPTSKMDSSFSRRHYWMSDEIKLKGNEHQVIILSNLLRSFVQKQDLEKLIGEAKQELLEIEAYKKGTGFALPKEFDSLFFEDRGEVSDEYIF